MRSKTQSKDQGSSSWRVLLILSLLTLIGNTETVSGQSSLDTNCICYTDRMDALALECLYNQRIKDSIILEQKEVIRISDSIKSIQNQKFNTLEEEYKLQKSELSSCIKKRNNTRKRNKITSAITWIGLVLAGIFVY